MFADVRILIAENLETHKSLGLGLSNFCCLCNFSTARHREVIYLKEPWPNLAGIAAAMLMKVRLPSFFCAMVIIKCQLISIFLSDLRSSAGD